MMIISHLAAFSVGFAAAGLLISWLSRETNPSAPGDALHKMERDQ